MPSQLTSLAPPQYFMISGSHSVLHWILGDLLFKGSPAAASCKGVGGMGGGRAQYKRRDRLRPGDNRNERARPRRHLCSPSRCRRSIADIALPGRALPGQGVQWSVTVCQAVGSARAKLKAFLLKGQAVKKDQGSQGSPPQSACRKARAAQCPPHSARLPRSTPAINNLVIRPLEGADGGWQQQQRVAHSGLLAAPL